MAPSSEICPICNSPFYGRQNRLKCNTCELKYHTSCLDFTTEEINLLQKTTFKCEKCMNKPKVIGDETPVRPSGESSFVRGNENRRNVPNEKNSNEFFVEFESCKSNDNYSNAELMYVIQKSFAKLSATFQEQISLLRDEIKILKEENMKLQNLVSNANKSETNARSIGTHNHPQSETEVVNLNFHKSGNESQVNDANENKSQEQDDSWVKVFSRNQRKFQNPKVVSRQVTASTSSNPPKDNRKMAYGTSQNKNNLVCNKKRALFVTRFDPLVTSEDVEEIVKEQNISVKCTKLRTKYDSYSSFHVEVTESDFQTISNPNVWPNGIMIGPFYGKLRDSSVLKDRNVEENQNTAHNGDKRT